MSALERSRRLVTTFVALILYSASAWRLRQINRLMNPPQDKSWTQWVVIYSPCVAAIGLGWY